ncbi:hypothetical protein AALO_G00146220 [Alosa alosa]|uniref:Cytohesin Ubiquitin Protein Inducing domain-containing protein n=1 Tax=Alosa alosa TaxID=278164 RepID=A0AAV6GNN5_9TELE|nr:hypothetical protein AALO_G00146220 [Alosa alosa]
MRVTQRLADTVEELTGQLSSDYPLLPGEKPPQVRRRIGATFRLDEQSLLERTEPSALRAVEAELGLQQQIVVAARGLVQEGALNKAVRRSRQQQCRVEESKLKQLQDLVFHLRMQHGRTSPHPAMAAQRDHAISDDSSVADSAVLDDEERASQASQPSLELPPLDPSSSLSLSIGGVEEDDRPPIENSPWAESSLDQPYEKIKKKRSSSRRSNSPAVTPTLPPLELCVCVEDSSRPLPLPSHVRATQSNSAPCTPELQLRRGLSLRLPSSGYDVDQDRGRSRFPRRRVTDLGMSPEYSPLHVGVGNPLYHSSSEDSASEHLGWPHTSSSGCPPHGRAYAPEAGRHDYWYEPAPVTLPAHVRVSRAPSLREYPAHHPPCHPAHHPALHPALPRQLVSEQLKSWHQRQQLQRPSRPRSLDRHRQGALRIRNSTGRDSPLALQPRRLDQPPQTGLAPRVVDQNSGQWTTEDDALIISQV